MGNCAHQFPVAGCVVEKNITILQDNSSSKPHSLFLDFSDLVILEDLHFIGIARALCHTLF